MYGTKQVEGHTYDGGIVVNLGQELLQRGVLARRQPWVDQRRVTARLLLGLLGASSRLGHIGLLGGFLGWWLRRHVRGNGRMQRQRRDGWLHGWVEVEMD